MVKVRRAGGGGGGAKSRENYRASRDSCVGREVEKKRTKEGMREKKSNTIYYVKTLLLCELVSVDNFC